MRNETAEIEIGEIAGGPINEHKTVITSTDQVQVYETIMADANGNPTFTLLRGAEYAKDNRLLPLGWESDHADGPATRAFGIGTDEDFVGGGDKLTYEVPLGEPGRYKVSAKLLFQVITPRHADELFQFNTPAVATFQKMFEKADREPEVLGAVFRNAVVE